MSEVVVSGELTRVELDDGVATLRLDRPKVNALNVAMLTEIRDAARWLSESSDVRAVVIYGGERMFAAGADIKEMAATSTATWCAPPACSRSRTWPCRPSRRPSSPP